MINGAGKTQQGKQQVAPSKDCGILIPTMGGFKELVFKDPVVDAPSKQAFKTRLDGSEQPDLVKGTSPWQGVGTRWS